MSARERYCGHSRGVVVTNDGYGNFSESPMTPGQLAAREVAAKIADDIYRHANQAGICYYEFWKLISEAIDKERNAALSHAAQKFWDRCESAKRLQRINRGNRCPDCWETPKQWCSMCQAAHAIEKERR